ncbi:hypothetical protein [Streptomyces collinus]|uniref:hypothetical protein n=1 Tax=Streptomyces collinus TaxID=42684 RepID=UPI0029429365|nr:hypothetical protein [Streptomyces collinus]
MDRIRFADIDGDGRADYVRLLDLDTKVDVFYNPGVDTPGHDGWDPGGQILTDLTSRTNRQIQFADLVMDDRDDYIALNGDGAPPPGSTPAARSGPSAGRSPRAPVGRSPVGDRWGRPGGLGKIARNGAIDAWLNKGGDRTRSKDENRRWGWTMAVRIVMARTASSMPSSCVEPAR